MSMTTPRPIDEQRARLRSTLTAASRLLLCLDFDGTLAPIVDDPDEAAPTPENEAALATLASEPTVSTAIVSGRALADVRSRIEGPKTYAGNHGLELARRGSVAVHPIARKRVSRLETVYETLETVLAPVPNCRLENKRLTGTVHVRAVPSSARPVVRRHTQAIVDRLGGGALEVSTGKRIFEIGPSIPWGKGNAVALIAADMPPETVPIYIGDDVTDESAFRTVEHDGIGIRVGGDEPSAASCRIDSPTEVAAVLDWLGSVGVDLLERDVTRSNAVDGSSLDGGRL
ncbi:trehalose-phosphatase (plasmid) [Natronorubrum bangense]|uniref:Trehalose 6-phosphate phosphatase n=2 Tax=Natronorubrum bangense TaxID=61858 RepID=A0A4D6HSH6_9EURY|nr:trehalose-phosphatase [Natronorubrum bangense]QCC56833.1 trehalose-phosphatase [Natronorubrum bangense]